MKIDILIQTLLTEDTHSESDGTTDIKLYEKFGEL